MGQKPWLVPQKEHIDESTPLPTRRDIPLGGGVITVISWISFVTIYGAGPTFPPFYTWPSAVIGGVIIGYGIADFLSLGRWRSLKIGIALVCGTLAWTVQLAIQASQSTAVDLLPGAPSSIAVGLILAAVIVSLNEVRVRYKDRLLN